MRLLGVFQKNDKEYFITNNENTFMIRDNLENNFSNYSLMKNRDKIAGNDNTYGDGVFNFRYGPVTSGMGEAGIFNIYTYGERILSIDIDVSYKHRNIEQMMINCDLKQALKLSENVCGNFSFSHSLAFLNAVETILNITIDEKVKILRIIGLELERLYNHMYVFAKLSQSAMQNVLTSHLYGLFEELLRINKSFSQSRYLLGFNGIGGINYNKINTNVLREISIRIRNIKNKFEKLYNYSLQSGNFVDRLHATSILTKEKALSIGITGPSLRACGINEDLRKYDPLYGKLKIATKKEGDALARMEVRGEEFINSCNVINSLVKNIQNLRIENNYVKYETTSGLGVGACESPSGIIVYYIELKNNIVNYAYISTPSLFGYKAFIESTIGQIFTDFSFAIESFGINFADCAK